MEKALPVHIAARLCQPCRGALLRAKEEIVHVKGLAVIDPAEQSGQGGFAAGTAALNGHKNPRLAGHGPVNRSQQRQ